MFTYNAKVVRVIDGDTLVVSFDLGFSISLEETVRLYGINAPEISKVKKTSAEYKKGMAAKKYLEELLLDKPIVITTYKDAKEKYGRYLASIEIFNVDKTTISVTDAMVSDGHAERKEY
jgi:micrococcal nuclease